MKRMLKNTLNWLIKKISLRRLVLWTFSFFAISSIAGFFFVLYLSWNLPSVEQFDTRQMPQSTRIYDRSGEVLLYEISAGEKRVVVPEEEIPQTLKDATIAIEDQNFYTNRAAFDVKSILRAVWANLISGSKVQGASTITQQLARNAFLSLEKTWTRKIRELILAIKLAKYYSKDKILWLYLNEVPYGPTIYGASTASKAYFNKPVKEINLAEAALLAAIPQAPSYYSPWGSHTKELIERQRLVLRQMLSLGKISKEEYDRAIKTEISFQPQGNGIKAPHFTIALQDYLVKKYGEDMIRTGGLTVKSTLDWDLQEVAEKVVKEGAERNDNLYKGQNAALVAEETNTGQILAFVGSRDYFDVARQGNFNVPLQGLRQPGSALKPFAYLTAFSKGMLPRSIIFDVPTEFASNNPKCPILPPFNDQEESCFHPENYDRDFRGPISIRAALAQSINITAVKALYLSGQKDVVKTLSDFGITTLNDPRRYGLSLVLGGGEVKLIDMVRAYSTLAEEGTKREQTMVLEVKTSDGEVLEEFKENGTEVMNPNYVRMINDILSDQEARAPLFSGSMGLTVFDGYDVALKTGTTNDYRDAWAMGYTPSLAVGVWAGNNDNKPMQKKGGSILAAVPIWSAFMKEAVKKYPSEAFQRAEEPSPTKPIIDGSFVVDGQVHSELHYLDRNDLSGAYPSNPGRDPQYNNWEAGVVSWASQNIGVILGSIQNQLASSTIITIQSPLSGSQISLPLSIQATITSPSPLNTIKIFFGGNLIQEFKGRFESPYSLFTSFMPTNYEPQNLLEIEVLNDSNQTARVGSIVYGQ